MHYSKNGIWNFGEVDTETIKPKAPNGASGGVEFEAMRYLVGSSSRADSLHPLTSPAAPLFLDKSFQANQYFVKNAD